MKLLYVFGNSDRMNVIQYKHPQLYRKSKYLSRPKNQTINLSINLWKGKKKKRKEKKSLEV
jgi:hypothetical protein